MARVVLAADDLTGALDAGVHLLPADTLVATSPAAVDRKVIDACPGGIAVNCGTRHLAAPEAAACVASLVDLARTAKVACIVKKTDSALRGNVGAELGAAWRASGCLRLHFLPALPEMGRVTIDGIHYVDGKPVSQGRFGRDPFEPVRESNVAKLVSCQTDVPVTVVPENAPVPLDAEGIVIYDVSSQESMLARVLDLRAAGELGMVAGCAGLTQALSRVLDLSCGIGVDPEESGNLLVVCGSVNKTSRDQCAYAAAAGAPTFAIGATEKCDDAWLTSPAGRSFVDAVSQSWSTSPLTVVDGSGLEDLTGLVAIDTDVRQVVADHIGAILVAVCARGVSGRILVTGGDILSSFLAQSDVALVCPLGEPVSGIVAFELVINERRLVIYSKSGGFGTRELFVEMASGSRATQGEGVLSHA